MLFHFAILLLPAEESAAVNCQQSGEIEEDARPEKTAYSPAEVFGFYRYTVEPQEGSRCVCIAENPGVAALNKLLCLFRSKIDTDGIIIGITV